MNLHVSAEEQNLERTWESGDTTGKKSIQIMSSEEQKDSLKD